MTEKIIKYDEKELKSNYPYCYKRVEGGKALNGDTYYVSHSCMLREVEFEDMGATVYCCMIDEQSAELDTPCRHWDLFNKGNKLIKKVYIDIGDMDD